MTITDFSFLDPRIPRQLAIDIDAAEDDRLEAYQDSLGIWTCGRGHEMPPAAPGRSWSGFTIPQSTSDRWFCQDILNAIALAAKWPEFAKCDTEARQNALREIAFNMGGKWEGFPHTRAAIQAQDWQGAHDGLLDSLWAAEVQPHEWYGGSCRRCATLKQLAGPHDYCKSIKDGRATRLANYLLTGQYGES